MAYWIFQCFIGKDGKHLQKQGREYKLSKNDSQNEVQMTLDSVIRVNLHLSTVILSLFTLNIFVNM